MSSLVFRFPLIWILSACLVGQAIAQNPDLDMGFDAGISSDEFLMSAAIQDDGRIIVAGRFTTFQGFARRGVVRLLPDGTLDPSFGPVQLSTIHEIHALEIDPAGRILIGGYFFGFDGTPINCIARLNPDGSRDLTFNPGSGANYSVNEIIIQPDGMILLAGGFMEFNGASRHGLVRLLPDGSLDTEFNVGSGFSSLSDPDYPYVHCIELDEEGRILVGGWFDSYAGVSTGKLVRLLANADLDTSFNPLIGPWDAEINDILVLPDQRIRIVGSFVAVNGQPQGGIAGLLSNGTIDPSFISGDDIVQNVSHLMDDVSGILIAGMFSSYNGMPRLQLIRVDHNGQLDQTYDIEAGLVGAQPYIQALCRQPDSKTVVVGNFESYNGVQRIDVLRLGEPTDCLGAPGGLAMPGTPCDDGIFFTTNDTWTAACLCQGFDCAGVQGGGALPGTPCDDGLSWTYNDTWSVGCVCQGVGLVGVGEQENSSGGLLLWPNPSAAEEVWVQVPLPSGTMAQIDIHDALGRRCWSQATVVQGTSPVQLRTSGFAPGVYLVNILSTQGSFTGRLVVR